MLPNFVVIGAMKSGTSSLYEYLQAHPRIFMPEIKEPDYFATAESFDRRGEWYETLFRDANGARAVGEASTSYTKFPDVIGVPQRMAQTLPDVRLIYVVRDPIERIRSQYLHELLMSEQREPLEAALSTHARYVNYSRYWMQIQQFLEWFPADRLLVIKSESLRDERLATLASICRFLGVDPEELASNVEIEYHRSEKKRVARPRLRRLHESATYRSLSKVVPERLKSNIRPLTTWTVDPDPIQIPDDIRVRLEDQLREDVTSLKRFLGPEFDGWGLA